MSQVLKRKIIDYTKIIVLVWLSWGFLAQAQEWRLQVKVTKASLYEAPSQDAKVLGHLSQGRVVIAQGAATGGFYALKTKSGRAIYVAASEVRSLTQVDQDLVTEEDASAESASASRKRRPITYDLGFASGSGEGGSFTELNLGLNYPFKDWLIWRNALFYRRFSDGEDLIGLDSSLRGVWAQRLSSSTRMWAFAGPGVRLPSEGVTAPFVEAGAYFNYAGLTLGGGFKYIANELMDKDKDSDTQYFLVLGGSGAF